MAKPLDLRPVDAAPAHTEGTQQLDLQPVDAESGVPVEEPSKNRGFLTSAEVEQIAKNRKVSAEELKAIVPFYNIDLDDNTEYAKRVAGFLSEGVASGVPAFINKKLQNEPMKAALDDLRELVDRQKTPGQMVMEAAAGMVATGGLVKGATATAKGLGTAARLATGGVAGAAGAGLQGAQAGLAHSKEGEELGDAAVGAALGVGLAAATKIPSAVRWVKGKFAGEAAQKAADSITPKITQMAEDGMERASGHLTAQKNIISQDVDALMDIDSFSRLPDATPMMDAVVLPESKAAKEALAEQMRIAGLKSGDEAQQRAFIAMKREQEQLRSLGGYLKSGNEDVRVSLDDAVALVKSQIKREGMEVVQSKIRDFQEIVAAKHAVANLADQGLHNMKGIQNNFFSSMANFMGDAAAYVAPKIDRQLGTNLTPTIDRLASKTNQLSLIVAGIDEAAVALKQKAETLGVKKEVVYDILDGKTYKANMSPAEEMIAKEARAILDAGHKKARDMGLPIPKRDNYITHTLADFTTVMTRMDQKAKQVEQTLGRQITAGLDLESFLRLKESPLFSEYLDGLGILTGTKIHNAKTYNAALKMMEDTADIGARYGTVASASLTREGLIPEFLREKDVYHLLTRWHANTFRHILYRNEIDELKKVARIAAARGDTQSADYVTKLAIDLSGGNRDNTLAKTINVQKANFKLWLGKKAADESRPMYERKALQVLSESPEILTNMASQLYRNVLGWSPKAVFTNVLQPASMGIPELGGVYGSKLVAKGYLKALSQAGQMTETLQRKNKLGASWQRAQRELEQGIITSSPQLKASRKAISDAANVGMYLYEKSEVLSKLVTHHMAEELSTDLVRYLKGGTDKLGTRMGKAAQDFVKTMPTSYQREVSKAVKSGNEEALREAIGNYMQSKIVFNYTRASMSEFGRSMGPMFSTFLKWPTSIAGDVVRNVEEKGLLGGSAHLTLKYGAPYMALNFLNNLLMGDEEQLSPRQEALMGKGGLTRLSPAGNLKSILGGDFLSPPAVEIPKNLAVAAVKTFEGLAEGKGLDEASSQAKKAGFKALQAYGPGMGFFRFIGEDAPAILTGEKAFDLKETIIGD